MATPALHTHTACFALNPWSRWRNGWKPVSCRARLIRNSKRPNLADDNSKPPTHTAIMTDTTTANANATTLRIEDQLVRLKRLSKLLGVGYNFVRAMHLAGMPTPGGRTTVRDAKRWLKANPDFKPVLYYRLPDKEEA